MKSELTIDIFFEILKSKKNVIVEEYLPLTGDFISSECNVEIITPLILK